MSDPTVTTYQRRDIYALAPDDPIVIAYGDAVAAMRDRPDDDPGSWTYQAAIHGSGAFPAPALANECRHQSWWFLPWHRMYLYYFERIVRAEVMAQGGPADWALPYWDYDRDGTRTLPEAFRNPTRADGSDNPLFTPSRRPGINAATVALPQAATSAAAALARPLYTGTAELGGGASTAAGQFRGMTGRLEQTPHNDIHVLVGGSGGLMGNPDTAALDPIFWLHHANVDRLWWVWAADAAHTDPTDAAWLDQSFSFFDADGSQVALSCGDVVDIVGQLGYTYRAGMLFPHLRLPPEILALLRRRLELPPWVRRLPMPAPRPPSDEGTPEPSEVGSHEIVGGSDRPVSLVGRAETVRVAVDARARRDALGDAVESQVLLDIDEIDAEANPGAVYGVYVNLPEEPSDDELRTYHVGNISLFGIERTHESRGDEHRHGAMSVTMDITDLTRRLGEQGRWDPDSVEVSFRPLALDVVAAAGDADVVEGAGAVSHEELPISVGRVTLRVR